MATAAQSSDRTARIKRIKTRGCPEVIEALEREELGIKTLERITQLPLSEQSKELTRLVEARRAKRERQATWRADPQRGKAAFASQAYAEARGRRLRRIAKRATAELEEAYDEGHLSLRQYDLLSNLSSQRQRKAVALDRDKERAQNLAAATIRMMLANASQRIDLNAIASAIIASIRSP